MTSCQVCAENLAKYKCPACSKETCSLGCVRSHKIESSCTGKRPRSIEVSIKEFDDTVLYKDFDLLEESQTSLFRCRPTARPDHLRKRDKLKSECYQRGTHLKLMPHVFSMAQSNSSTIRNRKDESGESATEILWKIDWRFPAMDTVLTDTCVSETKTIAELISRFFDNSWKLGSTRHLFPGTDELRIDSMDVTLVNFQKEEVKVDPSVPIRQALKDHAILEYPTFVIRQRSDCCQTEPVSG